jgi:hypothetical protein
MLALAHELHSTPWQDPDMLLLELHPTLWQDPDSFYLSYTPPCGRILTAFT